MDEIKILTAISNINATIHALELSLSDIVKKHPTRLDLIEPMKTHSEALNEALNVFRELEKENRMLITMNFNYHKECLELKYELDKIKKEAEFKDIEL